MNIVLSVQNIIDLLKVEENRKLGFLTISEMKELDEIADFLGIDKKQALVFCTVYFLTLKNGGSDPYRTLEFISDSAYDLPKIMTAIDDLVKMKLVEYRKNYRKEDVKVSRSLILKLDRNEKPDPISTAPLDFFEIMDELIHNYNAMFDEYNDAEEAHEALSRLFDEQSEFEVFTYLTAKGIDKQEWPMFIYAFLRQIRYKDYAEIESGLRHLYKCSRERYVLKRKIMDGSADMFKLGLVEHPGKPLQRKDVFQVTDNVLREILSDKYDVVMADMSKNNSSKDMISPAEITPRKLFYNEEEGNSVRILEELLQEERLSSVRKGLEDAGHRNGICILLHGAPGTGKTETVLQLALQTGRPIMKVDSSAIKDKYVGESEKRMKELFNKYKAIKNNSDIIPILLINEADAILSKRINVTSSIDQMNNTLQNILLEEMENFDGILFATTNLVPNLDTAFERRFLYKIEYTSPNAEVRSAIWSSHFPELSQESIKMISESFSFSGGQIENIVRKATLNNLLFGISPDADILNKYCWEESLIKNNRSKIGFKD